MSSSAAMGADEFHGYIVTFGILHIAASISALLGEMSSLAYAAGRANSLARGSLNHGNILSNKTLTNQPGKVDNYVSGTKGNAAAKADFNTLNPSNVRTYANGTIVGDLPNGATVNLHSASSLGGTPTVEIYYPTTGFSIKIRY